MRRSAPTQFAGVSEVRGSDFVDTLLGSNVRRRVEAIRGRGGNDSHRRPRRLRPGEVFSFDRRYHDLRHHRQHGGRHGDRRRIGRHRHAALGRVRPRQRISPTLTTRPVSAPVPEPLQCRQQRHVQRNRGNGRQRHHHRQRQHPDRLLQRHRRRDRRPRGRHRDRRRLGRQRQHHRRRKQRRRLSIRRHAFRQHQCRPTPEQFEGRAGDDFIDGRLGFDQAVYGNDIAVTTGICVDMAAAR